MRIEDIKVGETYWCYIAGGRKKGKVSSIDTPSTLFVDIPGNEFLNSLHPRQLAPIKKKPKVKLGRTFWLGLGANAVDDFPVVEVVSRENPSSHSRMYPAVTRWIEVREVLK